MNLNEILAYVYAGIAIIMAIVTAITNIVKNLKIKEDKNAIESLKEDLQDNKDVYKLVNEIIPLAIKKAEDTPNIDGTTKKLLALSEILLQCSEVNIDFELYKDFISEQVENLIVFSKSINAREEDITKE